MIEMAMGNKYCSSVCKNETGIGKHRKIQYHLVNLCFAVTPYTQDFFSMGVEHGCDRLRRISARQVIARAVVKQISKQYKPVRLFICKGRKQFFTIIGASMDIGSDHQFHLISLSKDPDGDTPPGS